MMYMQRERKGMNKVSEKLYELSDSITTLATLIDSDCSSLSVMSTMYKIVNSLVKVETEVYEYCKNKEKK